MLRLVRRFVFSQSNVCAVKGDKSAKQVRSATRHLAAESELPFVGHITIGRIKGNKKTDLEGTEIEASFQVRKLLLVESVLHPEGPEYSIMQTKHLF